MPDPTPPPWPDVIAEQPRPAQSLADWVRQQLDDDDAHMGRHDPARALRQVAAHRAVLDLYNVDVDADGKPFIYGGYGEAYAEAVAAIATIYADRPGYHQALADWPTQPEATP